MPAYSQQAALRNRRLSRNLVPERPQSRQGTLLNVHEEVKLLDVTQHDVRCVLKVNPAIGDTVSFDAPSGSGLVTVSGLVHSREMHRHDYEIGLFLPTGLNARLSELQTDARRKGNRYRCRQPGMFYRHKNQQRLEAVAVNYSYDGFAVQTESFCDVDESVIFEWVSDGRCQTLSGHVLWQIEQQHGVLLGCQVESGTGYRIAGLDV